MKILISAVVLAMSSLTSLAQDSMEIEIIRSRNLSQCTIGTMGVNNASLAASLELPWNDNQTNISRIPAGSYQTILRYDHADAWRLELTNVPGHSNIQIHIGNWPADTHGCILIGKVWNGGCAVQQSSVAYSALKKAFYGTDTPTSSPNRQVTVVIKDPPAHK